MRNSAILRQAISMAVVVIILLISFPRTSNFPFQYKRGSVWKYETLFSQVDFPILKTAEQMQLERQDGRQEIVPYYKFNDETAERSIHALGAIELRELEPYRSVIVSSLRNIYEKGIVNDSELGKDVSAAPSLIYIQKDKRAMKYPSSEIYRQTDARSRLLKDLSGVFTAAGLDSLLRYTDVYGLIVPNLDFDRQTTDLVSRENTGEVSPTLGYVTAGQQIVSKGEIVTSEVEQILDSYRQEYNSSIGYSRHLFFLWLADFLMACLICLILYASLYFLDSEILRHGNTYMFALTVFVIIALSSLVLVKTGVQNYLYMVPFTVCAMWLRSFFDRRVSLGIYASGLIPMLVFAHSGLPLFLIFLIGGGCAIFLYDHLNRGWKQFLMALLVFLAMTVTYSSLRLLDIATGNALLSVALLFVSAFLSVAIYPLVYLFERIFGLVSQSRLSELADTSNKLLRELEKKAPGTFQHSLQVANMADAAARAIGADPLLLRVGALYHDIGKTTNPQCFVENESLVTKDGEAGYHSGLSPEQSARDIIRHVPDGLEMAEKGHIPAVVREFIVSHHGTSCVTYFYDKFITQGGDPALKRQFVYDGVKPRTREQVILMLCDSIEAASRTLKDYSTESFSAFVENIVAGKQDQLDESEISIRDLGTVKEVLKNFLAQIYHERIVYPKRRQK